jgi:hypothetical protein
MSVSSMQEMTDSGVASSFTVRTLFLTRKIGDCERKDKSQAPEHFLDVFVDMLCL